MPRPTTVRPHAGVDHVEVRRVDVDVGAAGLRVDVELTLPVLPAVDGLEYAALFVGTPFMPHPARVDDIGIVGVDANPRDPIGILEADVRPRIAAIVRPVHAIAERGVVAWVLLARADVDDLGVRRRQLDRADRDDVLLVEDRLPRRAAVGRFEDAAVGARHVHRVRIAGNPDDHRHAAGLVGGADVTERQALQRVDLGRRTRRFLRANRELENDGQQNAGADKLLHMTPSGKNGSYPNRRVSGARREYMSAHRDAHLAGSEPADDRVGQSARHGVDRRRCALSDRMRDRTALHEARRHVPGRWRGTGEVDGFGGDENEQPTRRIIRDLVVQDRHAIGSFVRASRGVVKERVVQGGVKDRRGCVGSTAGRY